MGCTVAAPKPGMILVHAMCGTYASMKFRKAYTLNGLAKCTR